jgi:mRNA-degrading endonuclease RelE of RelBE toxin-antitoxin system
LITFIETRLFTRKVGDYLSVEEYRALQWELATRPDIGDIIPASGGVRKVRWAGKGRGKRGGLRIIYYWRTTYGQILLLTLYAKNETADITAEQLELILREVNS